MSGFADILPTSVSGCDCRRLRLEFGSISLKGIFEPYCSRFLKARCDMRIKIYGHCNRRMSQPGNPFKGLFYWEKRKVAEEDKGVEE